MDSTSVVRPPTNPAKRILPPHPVRAAVVILSFTALLYLIELVNYTIFHGSLAQDGIHVTDKLAHRKAVDLRGPF